MKIQLEFRVGARRVGPMRPTSASRPRPWRRALRRDSPDGGLLGTKPA